MKTLEEISLTSREREALREAARVLRERFPVEQVILFGSKARGQGDAESDLDLLILTSRELPWKERDTLVDALFEIQLAYDVLLSPLVLGRHEWEEGLYSVVPLQAEVARDGIAV
jgi:predicted nucleotidyltransferase